MNATPQRHQPEKDPLITSRLLELGFSSGSRPVDSLIARLERPDGQEWFDTHINGEVLNALGTGTSSVPLATLNLIKERSKQKLGSSSSYGERLEGLLGYFLSVAGALTWHGQLICSRSAEEVRSVLADLSTVTPCPWQTVLAKASLPRQ